MATASPTPMPVYASGALRVTRHPSTRYVRRDSPPSNLALSQSVTAPQRLADDSDDDLQPPPQLSDLGRSVLEQQQDTSVPAGGSSPKPRTRVGSRVRVARTNTSESNTPARDTTTPAAPSQRVRRVGLQGAPVRRGKRTPQSEEEHGSEEQRHQTQEEDHESHHDVPSQHGDEHPPERDQENAPASMARRSDSAMRSTIASTKKQSVIVITDSAMRPDDEKRNVVLRERSEKPVPLAQMSANTPHRPAPPPPPPKMSMLEAATKAAGASTTRKKTRRPAHFVLNGKNYSQMEKCGKGGSAEVYRVQAENGKMFALKRVKLDNADPNAVAGYKGEIDLLKKLQDASRVVRLYDYSIDEEKQALYVLMELGEGDLGKVLTNKMNAPADSSTSDSISSQTLDFPFIRYWWKEMLECVSSVHDKAIVHSDLKPANFLLVKGSLKLIDFGIAGAIDIENTVNMHRDNHVGTPNYMSPESLQESNMSTPGPANGPVAIGKYMKLGKPSDVWSLGCILYQMVYGQTPFAHIPQPMSKVLAIINPKHEIVFPMSGLGDTPIPSELRRTIKMCLQRDPSKRPKVSELLTDTDPGIHREKSKDLRIPEQLLDQIIRRVAERFKDKSKPPPTEEEIAQYAGSFYSKIRAWDS